LLKKDGALHAKFILQAFPKDQNAYWLDFAQLTRSKEEPNYDDFSDDKKDRDESYLQFLFSNANLRIGMLLAFLGCILFLIFRSKRQRPVIPLKQKARNTSVEFSRTVASIFLSRQNPHGLLQLQKKNFYDLIVRYFFIDLNDTNSVRAIESLSQKANVPVDEIQKLLQLLETKVKINVDEAYLFDVNRRKGFDFSSPRLYEHILERVVTFSPSEMEEDVFSLVSIVTSFCFFKVISWTTALMYICLL
jgi:hypothetical protein